MGLMSTSRFAQVARQRAEQQVRFVDPATLAQAVDENVEAQAFCFWARLCIYAYGRITPVLRSYLDERCPGFVDTVRGQKSPNLDVVAFWHMLQEWIETHVFERAVREGWRDALGYYTAAHPRYKKVSEQWSETQRALDDRTIADLPLYEFWRDEQKGT